MNLSEIPTSELVEELESRAIASVIILTMATGGDMSNTNNYRSGNPIMHIGMLETLAFRLKRVVDEESEVVEDGED